VGFGFWHRWLFISSVGLSLFGLVLFAFPGSLVVDILFNREINTVFWGSKTMPANLSNYQQWIYGLLGATIAGWGIVLAFLSAVPFGKKENWSWWAVFSGLVVWFLLDTFASPRYQVTYNTFVNIVVMLMVGLPLLFTRKNFFRSRGKSAAQRLEH